LADGEVVVAKGVHRGGSRGYVDLVVVPVDAPDQMHSESIPLLGIEAADLERMARSSWAGKVEFFGGYQGQPYRRGGATDLILVAERAEKGTG